LSADSNKILQRAKKEAGVNMGGYKELALFGRRASDASNEEAVGKARALGWEIDGRRITCPVPYIVFDLNGVSPYIYFHQYGSTKDAIAYVCECLELPEPRSSKDNKQFALKIWEECRPAQNTVVEKYLRARGITLPIPDCLRFHPYLKHAPTRRFFENMVALITSVDGHPQGIHRTYLFGDRKADVERNKATLGPRSGHAIQLAPAAAEMGVGEGIETCLSAIMLLGIPVWSGVSAGGMAGLVPPKIVRRIVVLQDNDGGPGPVAARDAALRFRDLGLDVEIRAPNDGFKDFNDQLIGKRS
jgi:hypothetical protein